jgi:capsular exopolysaccharide synthesis family protein
MAALVANTIANVYIEQNLEAKFQAVKETSDWLTQQLEEQRKNVQSSEAALQRYREQHEAVPTEERQRMAQQKLTDLNTAVTRAKTERIEKEAIYRQIDANPPNAQALDIMPAVQSNGFIQDLKGQLVAAQRQERELAVTLGDLHPTLVAARATVKDLETRLQAERAKVVETVRAEFLAAQNEEVQLMQALQDLQREMLLMRRKEMDYDVLQRDATSDRQVLDSLVQRAKETGVTGELRTSNIRIIDAADVPRNPVSPLLRRNLMLSSLVGFILAVCFAFFAEYLDTRIKSPDEIKTYLRLPCIGLLPALPSAAAGDAPLLNNGVPSTFKEAFRAVRTQVLFAGSAEPVRSIVVTSTRPGEGKTVVATNLALGLAMTGHRVLLIDADLRRPRIHDVFNVPQEPGLSAVVLGTKRAREVAHQSQIPGLWVLPAGAIPPNPAELLSSTRFKDLLKGVSTQFDWVIIDSPPVMAVTDASVLAHLASGVLFVVRSEGTSRPAAMAAIEQLEAAQARFVGAVLNRVKLDRNSFFYSQYYSREYRDYYASSQS